MKRSENLKFCMGEGGLLLLPLFSEKKSEGYDLDLERLQIDNDKHFNNETLYNNNQKKIMNHITTNTGIF